MTCALGSMAGVPNIPISGRMSVKLYRPEGTTGPRFTCQSGVADCGASALNAKTLLCMVATYTTLYLVPPMATPDTYSGCEYTCPSTGKVPIFPNVFQFICGERMVSCRLAPV